MKKSSDVLFVLNGKTVRAKTEERLTLLKYLRNVECLRGTKEACGMGQCGACSVLIDGSLARSCVVLVKNLQGKSVETIEHEASDGQLSIIQKSFLDAGAVQCGFCTPGMIMAAKALLLKNSSPSDEEIREGMKNNYCRCTGYVKIIEAVKLAAERLKGKDPLLRQVQTCNCTEIVIGSGTGSGSSAVPAPSGRWIGASVRDVDGPAKVTGFLKYRNFPAYAYATQAAIVEVDVSNGKTRVLKVIAAHDVGRAVNPRIIEGQMHGSISMGLGYALTEGHPTKDGYPVKKTYKSLGLPKFTDTPDYHLILVEDPEPLGPYGAKGISEVATVPITPAVINAISRAIGVRINKIPASPDVILDAIHTGSCPVKSMEEQVKLL